MPNRSFRGVEIAPHWRVVAAGQEAELPRPGVIGIHPSAAFGDGTHESTQLCLLALGHFLRSGLRAHSVLDFGSGSGILGIAAAKHGARVEAVEIDAAALSQARENARWNRVEPQIDFRSQLSEPARPFDIVLANVLRKVLLEVAKPLCDRQSKDGRMVLSGLVSTDVPELLARYRPLLSPMRAEVYQRGDFRAIVFTP